MERTYATSTGIEALPHKTHETHETRETLMTKVQHTLGRYATALSGVFVTTREMAASTQELPVHEACYADVPMGIAELAKMSSHEKDDLTREVTVGYVTSQQMHLAVGPSVF